MPLIAIRAAEFLRRRREQLFLTGAVLALLCAAAAALPSGAVWITDNGNKAIICRNFAETGQTALRHPMPEFFPLGGFHFLRLPDGTLRSFYLEFMPLLSAPFLRIFGERGMLFFPFAGTLALVWCLAGMLRRHKLLFAAFCSATPLIFFSLLLWETTPAAAFSLIAGILLLRGSPAAAGAMLGAGLLFREELYCVAAVFGAALLIRKERGNLLRFSAGFLLAALPIWLWQYLEFGHVLGVHGSLYRQNNRPASGGGIADELRGIVWNYYHHLFQFDVGKTPLCGLPLIPLFLAAVAGAAPRFDSYLRLKRGLAAACFVSWAVLIPLLWRRTAFAYTAAMTAGLLTATPFLLGFLLNWRPLLTRSPGTVRFPTLVSLLYLILVPPLLTRHDLGLIWGARHFMPIIPFMVVPAWIGWRALGGSRRMFLLPLAAGAAIQLYGLYALWHVAREGDELSRLIEAAPPKTVVTDVFFLPEQTPRIFFEKTVLEVNDRNAEALLRALRARGEKEFLLVLSPGFRRLSDPMLAKLLAAAPVVEEPIHFRREPGSGFMELYLARCRFLQKRRSGAPQAARGSQSSPQRRAAAASVSSGGTSSTGYCDRSSASDDDDSMAESAHASRSASL